MMHNMQATATAYAALQCKAEAQLAQHVAGATAKAQAAAVEQMRKSAADRHAHDRCALIGRIAATWVARLTVLQMACRARHQQHADRQAQKQRSLAEQQQERLALERRVADAQAAEVCVMHARIQTRGWHEC